MKNLVLPFSFLLVSGIAFAQSNSYESLRDNFKGGEDVVSMSIGGFLLKTTLWIIENEEADETWMEGIKEINHLRFINIPKAEFANRGLKLNSFRKYVIKDGFEQLLVVKEESEEVQIYVQESAKKRNRYLIIAEEDNEVTVFEFTGYIDIEKLTARERQLLRTEP